MKHTVNISNSKIVKHLQSGFSLIEMAVVLVIMGIMLTMLMTPLRAQRELKTRHETEQSLAEAKQALLGYALINHHLPCADTDAIPDGIPNVKADGSCERDEGILPWQELGIAATDAWGRYFRYRADATFTNSKTFFSIDNAENASSIQVIGETGASASTAAKPVAVILSHGANGLGGVQWVAKGQVQALPASTNTDELENSDADINFVDQGERAVQGAQSYDDLLVWLSPKVLIASMVQAHRLP